jgi:hypothetical protein
MPRLNANLLSRLRQFQPPAVAFDQAVLTSNAPMDGAGATRAASGAYYLRNDFVQVVDDIAMTFDPLQSATRAAESASPSSFARSRWCGFWY